MSVETSAGSTGESGETHRGSEQRSVESVTEAEALGELEAALSPHGITLPSLRLCPLGLTGSPPLVDLGSAGPGTVHALAAVLRRAADGSAVHA